MISQPECDDFYAFDDEEQVRRVKNVMAMENTDLDQLIDALLCNADRQYLYVLLNPFDSH